LEIVEKPWSEVTMMSAQGRTDAREIVVGIADRRKRGRSVDAGSEAVQAVALVMLGPVRIARPEHQHERLIAFLEHRQDGARGDAVT
jgi:hypothetical protein